MKKHMKKREPAERITRKDLRRDGDFARQLAEEWGMEQTTPSYRKALRQVYAELPDELPVKRYPLRQAMKGLAAVAAVFVMVCVGLFTLNAAQPQIAEALPGVGGVFRALNQPEEGEESPAPQATPTPDSGESQVTGDALDAWGQEIAGGFTPVEIPGSRGSLWVDCAWSDGASLVLDLRLELGDYGDSLYQQAPGLELVPAYGEVSLNGQIVASGETLPNGTQDMVCAHQIEPFTWAGDGAFTGRWVLDLVALGEDATASGECQVTLAMDALTAQNLGEEERASLENSGLLQQVGSFASDSFPAPVVRDYNTAFQGGATDNGASLQGVSFAPTQLAVSLELPFLGRTSYYLQPATSLRATKGRDTGAAGSGYEGVVAATESGRVLQVSPYYPWMTTGGTDNYGPYQVSCAFTGLYPGEDKVIITVYDASQVKRCYDDSGNFTGADPGLFQVVASFTLDLTTQTADPNWDYLDEGYQQLHLDTYPADSGNFLGGFTNGFYVGNCQLETGLVTNGSRLQPCQLVTLFASDLDYRPVTLVAYAGEESYTVWSQDPTALNSYDELGGVYYHQEEASEYWESVTDQDAFGGTYRVMEFRVYYPTELLDGQGQPIREFDKLQLLDGETGEVLIEDVAAALAQQRSQLLGTAPAGQTDEEEAVPEAEASPVPQW